MAVRAQPKSELQPQASQTPATLSEDELTFLQEHKGEGISTAAEDNFVPLVYVLQTGSRQVIQGPAHIEGAIAGSFLMRNAPQPIVDGDSGFVFQPCYFYKDFAEWIPRERGGGLVGMHRELPGGVEEIKDPRNPNKIKWRTSAGNEILERRNHLGFVVQDNGSTLAYAIPFTSTGHSVSRNWMTVMQNRTINGMLPPSYAFLYRFRTRQRSNAQGNWYVSDIQPELMNPNLTPSGMCNPVLRDKGKAFFEACKAGDKLAAEMEERDEPRETENAAF
jgi:hypothetical protein